MANEVASRYRARPRDELLRLLKEQDTFELVAPSGTHYQLEVEAVWDDRRGRDLRVFVEIDDGGQSAFRPLVVDFMSPRMGGLWAKTESPLASSCLLRSICSLSDRELFTVLRVQLVNQALA